MVLWVSSFWVSFSFWASFWLLVGYCWPQESIVVVVVVPREQLPLIVWINVAYSHDDRHPLGMGVVGNGTI